MQKGKICRTTTIEELLELKKEAVSFLFERGIRCIRCGEPIWDTIENAARQKNFSDADIDQLLVELNDLT